MVLCDQTNAGEQGEENSNAEEGACANHRREKIEPLPRLGRVSSYWFTIFSAEHKASVSRVALACAIGRFGRGLRRLRTLRNYA